MLSSWVSLLLAPIFCHLLIHLTSMSRLHFLCHYYQGNHIGLYSFCSHIQNTFAHKQLENNSFDRSFAGGFVARCNAPKYLTQWTFRSNAKDAAMNTDNEIERTMDDNPCLRTEHIAQWMTESCQFPVYCNIKFFVGVGRETIVWVNF